MLVGIDEVGRGCWAGPVVAGAVALGRGTVPPGLKDSKKLTKAQRDKLDILIRSTARACGIGWASPQEVDEFGLTQAVRLAMERALAQISIPFTEVIIDGRLNFLNKDPRVRTLTKADGYISCVSAASIIAKVARDNYMIAAAEQYPGYAFENHVGYGTPEHQTALQTYGRCNLHRKSFKPVALL